MKTPEEGEKRPSLLRRLVAFVVTLALVLGAVALVVNRDKLNMDSIKRYFTYRSLERSETGQAQSFTYAEGSSAFAAMGDGLLVGSSIYARVYSSSGTLILDQAVSMANPVAVSAGDRALVYDAGGRSLYVFSDAPEPFSLILEEGDSLLSASLNDAGYLAVVSQERGHRGTVTIYDDTYQPVIQINRSSSFVSDAAVSPDCQWAVLVTLGLSEAGTFESQLSFYRLDRSEEEVEPDFTCPVGSSVGLGLRWTDRGVWLVGENTLTVAEGDGALQGSYDYTGRYLKAFSLEADGCAVLLLGKYRAGSVADLVVVDPLGEVSASLPMTEQVLSLSAAGKYISVLTAGKLTIYTRDLEVYRTLESTQSAQRAIQRSDGSVMLMGSSSAHLYVPE